MIVLTILGITFYLMTYFTDIHSFADKAELVRSIGVSLIGLGMGLLGFIKLSISTYKMVVKFVKDIKKPKRKKVA